MTLAEFLVLALSSLFVIVDPIALVPSFLAMTSSEDPEHRRRTARIACIVAAGILAAFAAVGAQLFDAIGVTMPAFQIAGSILLLLVALDMLRARRTEVTETPAERYAASQKEDVAVSPLAIPMLAGPGACTAVLLLRSRASDALQHALLFACIGVVLLASYVILALATRHAYRVKPIAMKVATRLMGMLLAAIAVQFFLDGVKASGMLAR